ncbi:aldehyde dehydrogenase family protein, partial [Nocardia wallacei]|uniref:aldehyde dehydrogenase family protein n=1 Tax=Nocardia wallacei TaxID=480035 RepID=UPI002458B9BC
AGLLVAAERGVGGGPEAAGDAARAGAPPAHAMGDAGGGGAPPPPPSPLGGGGGPPAPRGSTGAIWPPAHAPFGGYKQSGIGRELGVAGFEEYTETKLVATAE